MILPRIHAPFLCRLVMPTVVVTIVTAVFGSAFPTLAQTPLTQATLAGLRNQVKLTPQHQAPHLARLADRMTPGDSLATARSAQADLRFNDGSRARVGEQVVFKFQPGTRSFNLSNGTVLLLIPPGQGKTEVATPNAVTAIQGSALFVRYDAIKDQTIVGALTDSGIQVWNHDRTQVQTLRAGQMLAVTNGHVHPPHHFNLSQFYQTSSLAEGFRLNDATVVETDPALARVRAETLAGLIAQNQILAKQTAQGTPVDPDFVRLSSTRKDGFFEGDRAASPSFRSLAPARQVQSGLAPQANPVEAPHSNRGQIRQERSPLVAPASPPPPPPPPAPTLTATPPPPIVAPVLSPSPVSAPPAPAVLPTSAREITSPATGGGPQQAAPVLPAVSRDSLTLPTIPAGAALPSQLPTTTPLKPVQESPATAAASPATPAVTPQPVTESPPVSR